MSVNVSPLVLIVGINEHNLRLLARVLADEGVRSVEATSIEALDERLESEGPFRLALVDVSGFDRTIWARCERITSLGIPLLVIATRHDATTHHDSAVSGARGVLVKPLVMRDFLRLVHDLIGRGS